MRFQTLATMLACTAAFASLGANATETEPYQDAAYNGSYIIEVLPNNTADHSNARCITSYYWHQAYSVKADRASGEGLCGLGNVATNLANKNWVWDITPIKHTDGRKAYTLRNRGTGQCLHRGNGGNDLAATTWWWNPDTNPQWCGMNSADEVIENGQAAWIFGDSPVEGENLVSGIGALRNGLAYLSFASTNRVHLQPHQGMTVVDNVFRLTRVPEECTSHALQPDIMRVCGVGDFSQPVRVRDSAYLQMRFAPWNATASSENFYGKWDVDYMAIYPNDAHLYCSRLRTGNFSDWRMPTLAELRAMSAAFSNDALKASGWATGYRGHQTTDRFEYRGKTYFYSVRFYNGDVGEEWDAGDANPYPISCIR